MCFSVKVDTDIEKLSKTFDGVISQEDLDQFYLMQELENSLDKKSLREQMGLKSIRSSLFKMPGNDGRIYPGTFTFVIRLEKGKRVFSPMRYRVRPRGADQEIPSKYNVFNARLDSLTTRVTWKEVLGKQHCLFAFQSFFEWVEVKGEKKLIQFMPKEREIMWAPALYHQWVSPSGQIRFDSFALITDEPNPEVLAMGHDRSPLFLQESEINHWLEARDVKSSLNILNHKERVYYNHQFE